MRQVADRRRGHARFLIKVPRPRNREAGDFFGADIPDYISIWLLQTFVYTKLDGISIPLERR